MEGVCQNVVHKLCVIWIFKTFLGVVDPKVIIQTTMVVFPIFVNTFGNEDNNYNDINIIPPIPSNMWLLHSKVTHFHLT